MVRNDGSDASSSDEEDDVVAELGLNQEEEKESLNSSQISVVGTKKRGR